MKRILLLSLLFLSTCSSSNIFLDYKLGCSENEFQSITRSLLQKGTLISVKVPECSKGMSPVYPYVMKNGKTLYGLIDADYFDDKLWNIELIIYQQPSCASETLEAERYEKVIEIADLYKEKYGKPDSTENQLPATLTSNNWLQTQRLIWIRGDIEIGVEITPWATGEGFCRIYYRYSAKVIEKLKKEKQAKIKRDI